MVPVKVALVTASSAGLGAAIAKSLITDFRVVINYNSSATRAHSVLEELERLCLSNETTLAQSQAVAPPGEDSPCVPRFLALRADIGSRTAVSQLVDETVSKMGRLDVVISNGGWTHIREFGDLNDNVDEEDWDRCWNVNVKSHLWLLHAARVHLEQSDNGAFISVASVAGVKPSGSSIVSGYFRHWWLLAVSMADWLSGIRCLQGSTNIFSQMPGCHSWAGDQGELCVPRDLDDRECILSGHF
jgi:NAD(P)-dependent dehydrogenase (short-subunit alcohol dehydrogenase family)